MDWFNICQKLSDEIYKDNVEEIAYRVGFLIKEQIIETANKYKNNKYYFYVKELK